MPEGRAERRVWLALAGFIVAVVLIGLFSLLPGGGGDSLPVVATLPPFELVDSSGNKVSRTDLDGQVWVADFIFTNCAGICPILSARMAELQKALIDGAVDARLVSISVDPARDSPDALRAYGERFKADPERWWFLTGERAALYDLIGKGFLLSVAGRTQEEADADGGELITHSDRFVLVDRQGRIRGYYHGSDRESVAKLIGDVARLAAD
jgi:protein SCO1/2